MPYLFINTYTNTTHFIHEITPSNVHRIYNDNKNANMYFNDCQAFLNKVLKKYFKRDILRPIQVYINIPIDSIGHLKSLDFN